MLLLPHEPPDAPGFNIEIPPESGHLLGHPYAYSSAGQPARDAHYYTASLVHTGLHDRSVIATDSTDDDDDDDDDNDRDFDHDDDDDDDDDDDEKGNDEK